MPVFFCLPKHAKLLAEHHHESIPVSGDCGIIVPITGVALQAEMKISLFFQLLVPVHHPCNLELSA